MMKSFFICFVTVMGTMLPGQVFADWAFRGTPNGWSVATMNTSDQTGLFEICQSFGRGDNTGSPRFKIDRDGLWQESYPASDFVVQGDKSYRITFNEDSKTIDVSPVSSCEQILEDVWSFRGTPNEWGTIPMVRAGDSSIYITCQRFGDGDGGGGPRFKVSFGTSWDESYPNQDREVSPNQSYEIRFDSGSKDISVMRVASCSDEPQDSDGDGVLDQDDECPNTPLGTQVNSVGCPVVAGEVWSFRGTPNNWGTTPMEQEGDSSVYLICQRFSDGDDGGSPRFKVARGTSWDENYPAQDREVSPNQSYEIRFDSDSKDISVTRVVDCSGERQDSDGDGVLDQDDECPNTPSGTPVDSVGCPVSDREDSDGDGVDDSVDQCPNTPSGTPVDSIGCPVSNSRNDFREESIYFLLTARFFNGDPSNDYFNRDRITPGDPQWRGDFKGLIQQLDYIKDLGFTAIWITPPVENRSGLDYHGYHAYDWNTVDPRLESDDAKYQDFIRAAHQKGLKVVQDVVVNHSSQYGIRGQVWIDHLPIKYYVPSGSSQGQVDNFAYQGNLGDYQSEFRDDNDNPVAPEWFRERHNSDPEGIVPLFDPTTGETVPKPGFNPNRFFGIDAQNLDPNWYHQDGFIAGGDWESPIPLQQKHLAGDTIDLFTEKQNVRNYLNNAIIRYLDMGVDAIRVDTVKHMERGDLLSYVNTWKRHKPSLFVFGENLVKGTGFGSELANDNASAVIRPWWYTRLGNDPGNPRSGGDSGFSVLDFSLFSTFRDNVTRGNYSQVGSILSMDWIYGDATQLVTFFQNHDVGPDNDFKYRFGGDMWHAAIAYNLMWTIRGIPCLYYGEEIMFQAGLPQDIQGAEDTLPMTGRAYYGDQLMPDRLAQTQSHPLYRHIRRLNQIRRAIPALQKAPMSSVNEFGSGMSFVRNLNNGESVVVVGLATGGGQNFTVSGVPNGVYRDAVTGNQVSAQGGSISFSVRARSAGIYVLNGPGKIGEDGDFLR